VRDGKVIDQIDEATRPQEELGQRQARRAMEEAQGRLDGKKAATDEGDQRDLEKLQQYLSHMQEKLGREQEKIGRESRRWAGNNSGSRARSSGRSRS